VEGVLSLQASHICKRIAAKELQPPVLRPKTTDVVARRLLGHALANDALRDLVSVREGQVECSRGQVHIGVYEDICRLPFTLRCLVLNLFPKN